MCIAMFVSEYNMDINRVYMEYTLTLSDVHYIIHTTSSYAYYIEINSKRYSWSQQ